MKIALTKESRADSIMEMLANHLLRISFPPVSYIKSKN